MSSNSVIEAEISVIKFQSWIQGISETHDSNWSPDATNIWLLIWNKMNDITIGDNLASLSTVLSGFLEFRTWISGINELMSTDESVWSPSLGQWKKIVDKINTIPVSITIPKLQLHRELTPNEQPSEQTVPRSTLNDDNKWPGFTPSAMPVKAPPIPPASLIFTTANMSEDGKYTSPLV